MTALRQKMIEDMQLHGLSARTQDSYVRAVRQLAAHYHKPPDQIGEEVSTLTSTDRLEFGKLIR